VIPFVVIAILNGQDPVRIGPRFAEVGQIPENAVERFGYRFRVLIGTKRGTDELTGIESRSLTRSRGAGAVRSLNLEAEVFEM
jgi:hypothetical protein